jgi:hypothetical protein
MLLAPCGLWQTFIAETPNRKARQGGYRFTVDTAITVDDFLAICELIKSSPILLRPHIRQTESHRQNYQGGPCNPNIINLTEYPATKANKLLDK